MMEKSPKGNSFSREVITASPSPRDHNHQLLAENAKGTPDFRRTGRTGIADISNQSSSLVF